MKKVKVLVKLPGEYTEIREIEPTYNAVRDIIVDLFGPMPGTPQTDSDVMYYCADDGKYRGMVPNITLLDSEGNEFEVVFGPIVVVKYDKDDYMTSLSEDEIAFHKNWLDVRS